MAAYYNEIDPYAAQWLRNLIAAGHIAQGEVDERSICDVDPADLAGFTQCHFFAGIGVWSYALRLAGWPDDRPVWTGSCPCQPFSAAGKRSGFDDERHLWPEFFRLIRERHPAIVFGEQVASKDGLEWLDAVQADLEGAGYASAAADLCAAGVGAPHIRQRLWWVADAGCARPPEQFGRRVEPPRLTTDCAASRLANGSGARLEGRDEGPLGRERAPAERGDCAGGMADHHQNGRSGGGTPRLHERRSGKGGEEPSPGNTHGPLGHDLNGCCEDGRPSPLHGHWADADWLHCRDGKWRPVEPGTFPLAHGAPARVGRLRAYGNAIVPQVAQAFIEAVMEARP